MESSRDAILAAVRRQQPAPAPLPDVRRDGIQFDDPTAQFVKLVEAVGGAASRVPDVAAADALVRELPVFQNAQRILSRVPGVVDSTFDLDAIVHPHDLQGLDLAVLPGELAVAENGAVWVHDRNVKHRAAYFICEHLVLVVPHAALVHNMHEAYARLSFAEPRWGLFLSGPSKTADIEQSLVIGAQGPRSLTVVLVDG